MVDKKENKEVVKMKSHKHSALTYMALPVLIFVILFNYLPMFGVVLAFKKFNFTDGIFGSPWAGFANFKFLFATDDAFLITRNTIVYNVVFIILGVLIPITIAIMLNEVKNRFLSKVYQTTFIMPHFLSWVVVSYIAYAFLSPDKGIINGIVDAMGGGFVNWYGEIKFWPFILIFFQCWKTIGYNCVIYLAAITAIDQALYEAAVIDGANKWKQIIHITIPAIKPMITILTILAIGKIFYADFGLFYQVPRNSGQLYPVTNVIDTYVYNGLTNTGSVGMSAAAAFYQSILGFVFILTSNLIVRKLDSDNALF